MGSRAQFPPSGLGRVINRIICRIVTCSQNIDGLPPSNCDRHLTEIGRLLAGNCQLDASRISRLHPEKLPIRPAFPGLIPDSGILSDRHKPIGQPYRKLSLHFAQSSQREF
jgi:hypothetical protein